MPDSRPMIAQQVGQAARAFQKERTGHVPKAVTVVLQGRELCTAPRFTERPVADIPDRKCFETKRRAEATVGLVDRDICSVAVVAIIALAMISGCATTIIAPVSVGDPVSVYVIDYGAHGTLALPTEDDGVLVEYGVGEWAWFGLSKNGFFDQFRAGLCRTPAALSRRHIDARRPDWKSQLEDVRTIHSIEVSRADAARLVEELDGEWRAGAGTAVYNVEQGKTFIIRHESYTLFDNCTHAVARWVERLGCETRGWGVLPTWKVEQAEQKHPPIVDSVLVDR